MTLYAIAATLLLAALARHTVTVRRQRDHARTEADTIARDRDKFLGHAIDRRFRIRALEGELAKARKEVDHVHQIGLNLVHLTKHALPPVPRPTADQGIPAKPYTGPAIVIDLPTFKAPVKRARKVAAK